MFENLALTLLSIGVGSIIFFNLFMYKRTKDKMFLAQSFVLLVVFIITCIKYYE